MGNISLEWGEILFEGPYPTKRWGPLSNAGIYAIIKKPDAYNKLHTYYSIIFWIFWRTRRYIAIEGI